MTRPDNLSGRLKARVDAAHAPAAGTVAVEIDDKLFVVGEKEAVTLALRIAVAVDGGDAE